MPDSRSFHVRPRHDPHKGHLVEAPTFEEAAMAYVERWSPAVDAGGDVALLVRDREGGHEVCLRLSLDDGDGGDARPCGEPAAS